MPNKDDEIVCYILMRNDLGISPGKMIAQGAHAVQLMLDTLNGFIAKNRPSDYRDWDYVNSFDEKLIELCDDFTDWKYLWYQTGITKIVLGATEEEITLIKCRLGLENGYIISSVIDEGRTEIPPNTLTAACLQPMPRKIAKQFVGKLRLL